MPPELELVREWVAKAQEDLEAARRLLEGGRPLPGSAGFHCQQAAEKALKAFLEFRGIKPPKTHALGELLDLAESRDADFAALRQFDWLSELAVGPRYPGSQPYPALDLARRGLDAATAVFRFVLERTPKETHP